MKKQIPYIIETDRLVLDAVSEADCQSYYVDWLNDVDVNRYLETRWTEQNQESILQFVKSMKADPANYLFAMRIAETGKHIGNLKIGPINIHHMYADLSYFVGDRESWGKGYATEAIRGAIGFAFDQFGLHRLNAGVYSGNEASARVLEKCGFEKEGIAKNKFRIDDRYEDHWFYGLVNRK